MWGSRDPFLEFWGPPNMSRTVEARNFNLARRRMAVCSNEQNAKLTQKGLCGGHVTQFVNFGNPLISRERLKLKSSNLARIRKTEGSCGGHVTQFLNFRNPLISRELLKLETSNLARIRTAVSTNE